MKKQILICILIYSLICSFFIIAINSCGNGESVTSIIDIPVGVSTYDLENGELYLEPDLEGSEEKIDSVALYLAGIGYSVKKP